MSGTYGDLWYHKVNLCKECKWVVCNGFITFPLRACSLSSFVDLPGNGGEVARIYMTTEGTIIFYSIKRNESWRTRRLLSWETTRTVPRTMGLLVPDNSCGSLPTPTTDGSCGDTSFAKM